MNFKGIKNINDLIKQSQGQNAPDDILYTIKDPQQQSIIKLAFPANPQMEGGTGMVGPRVTPMDQTYNKMVEDITTLWQQTSFTAQNLKPLVDWLTQGGYTLVEGDV